MTPETAIPTLASLDEIPYLDNDGKLPELMQGKIGVYAIFDSDKVLQFVSYSRDIYSSLKQHLVRQPQQCHWLKVKTIDRPNRSLLEAIRDAWIGENGTTPEGNGPDMAKWNEPIDVRFAMTVDELARYEGATFDELTQEKILKGVARRVEEDILETLKNRGVQEEIRFNPKLKTSGLLDLK